MVMIYTTNVQALIGSTKSNAVNMAFKAFTYEEVQGEDGEGATPAMVVNQTTPKGYNPPHKYAKITLQAVSEAWGALYSSANGGPFIVPLGDNPGIPYLIITAKDGSGNPVTFVCANQSTTGDSTNPTTPNGAVAGASKMTIDATGKEVVTIYPFKCDAVIPVGTDVTSGA